MKLGEKKIKENILLMGYPGEYNMELWGMKSINNKLNNDQYIKINDKYDLLIYTNINTSEGQSGSPIVMDNVSNESKYIIGIHVGGDLKKKENYGTLFNNNKIEWINQCIKNNNTDIINISKYQYYPF